MAVTHGQGDPGNIGTEPREIIEYGNVLSPIIDLISYRYEHQLPTIITSNLTPQQISEVYGKRIGDRLKETTEIVPFLEWQPDAVFKNR